MSFLNKVNPYIFGDKGSGHNDKTTLICYYVSLVILNGETGALLVNCLVLTRSTVTSLLIKAVGLMIKPCFRCPGPGMLSISIVLYCVLNV